VTHKLILFFILLFSQISFSQLSAEVVYRIKPNPENFEGNSNDSKEIRDAKKMILETLTYAENLNYIVRYNANESLSDFEEVLITDDKNKLIKPIAMAIIGSGVYYQNKLEQISLWKLNSMGINLIIRDTLASNWTITNEQKQIGKFTCIKAIWESKTSQKYQEVWFAPEINVPFGPTGLGGLPGLILEVKAMSFILTVESIKQTKNEIEIERPTKGKKVTLKEYHEMTSKVRAN
jgi:GLPGLI family protein